MAEAIGRRHREHCAVTRAVAGGEAGPGAAELSGDRDQVAEDGARRWPVRRRPGPLKATVPTGIGLDLDPVQDADVRPNGESAGTARRQDRRATIRAVVVARRASASSLIAWPAAPRAGDVRRRRRR